VIIDSLIAENAQTLESSVNPTANENIQTITITNETISMLKRPTYVVVYLIVLLAIIFLIKSFSDKSKITREISEKTIKSVKTISIILFGVSLLCLFPIGSILTVIALIKVQTAQMFAADLESLKIKVLKNGIILNIIASLLILCFALSIPPRFTNFETMIKSIDIIVNLK